MWEPRKAALPAVFRVAKSEGTAGLAVVTRFGRRSVDRALMWRLPCHRRFQLFPKYPASSRGSVRKRTERGRCLARTRPTA